MKDTFAPSRIFFSLSVLFWCVILYSRCENREVRLVSKNKVLITGGAGFIGTNLALTLLEWGNTVIVVDCLNIDRVFGGKDSQFEVIRFMEDNYRDRFLFVNHDILKPLTDVDIFPSGIDMIFNLASPSAPSQFLSDPLYTIKTNFIGSNNVLDFAHQNGISKILQASTSEVYGNPDLERMISQREGYTGYVNPLDARAVYREGKRISETLFANYRRMYGLDTKIVRIFNTFGPYQFPFDGRSMSSFITSFLQGQNITIYGTGYQIRSFCFVDDLVDGMIRIMLSEKEFMGPVNLGHEASFSIIELASIVRQEVTDFFIKLYSEDEFYHSKKIDGTTHNVLSERRKMVKKYTKNTHVLFMEAEREDNVRKRVPSTRLAYERTGWKARTGIAEGIAKTIPYFYKKVVLGKSMAEIFESDGFNNINGRGGSSSSFFMRYYFVFFSVVSLVVLCFLAYLVYWKKRPRRK